MKNLIIQTFGTQPLRLGEPDDKVRSAAAQALAQIALIEVQAN